VRITPSIIPNRDSIPQNHPNPKEAVSNLEGAAVSMGGRLLLDAPVADCPLASASVLLKESVSMAIDIMNMVTFCVRYGNL
jgi:hypothetical protein